MKLKYISPAMAILTGAKETIFSLWNKALPISNHRSSGDGRSRGDKKQGAPLVPPPYDVVQFPPFELQDDAPYEEVMTKEWAFPAYNVALDALSAGTPAKNVPFLAYFLPGWETMPDTKAVRRAFVSEVFLSEVLYGYLAREMEASLASSLATGTIDRASAGRYGEAALLAFQRTGDTAYIDLYARFFDRLMLLRDNQLDYYDNWHEKVMDSWGSFNLARGKLGHGDSWIAHITHFAFVMMPATGFAREILANPDLSEYRDWANGVVEFFDQAYPQFDVDLRPVEGTDEEWYWRPVVEKFEALNHIHVLGQALLNMYAVSGNRRYEERIRTILRVFEGSMVINDDGMASWNYSPYFQVESALREKYNKLYSEPTWKGTTTVPFLYLAAQDGFTMSNGVLDAVTRSITDHVLADARPKLHTHPKGSRAVTRQELKQIPGIKEMIEREQLKNKHLPKNSDELGRLQYNFAGFIYAAMMAPEVSQQMRNYVAKNPEVFPRAWFTNYNSAPAYSMALSGRSSERSP